MTALYSKNLQGNEKNHVNFQIIFHDSFDSADTPFGCCLDEKTPAGPDGTGCPPIIACQDSLWGCCPDGVTPANGEAGRGCDSLLELTCHYSVFGCCADGKTTAAGPDGLHCPEKKTEEEEEEEEGSGEVEDDDLRSDCANSVYGCCPDGIQSAWGINYLGCSDFVPKIAPTMTFDVTSGGAKKEGDEDDENEVPHCEQTLFGCCQDGVSVAAGPEFKGCHLVIEVEEIDTNFSHEGLITLSSTPSPHDHRREEGTTRATTVVRETTTTTATTISCAESKYGCCPDGQRPAAGHNFENCGRETPAACANSQFGCCKDGVTPAHGPEYGECHSSSHHRHHHNHAKTPNLCSEPHATGPGRNFSVKWYFDVALGGCRRFWYGGDGGNRNRFDSEDICMQNCVEPNGPGLCFLPMVPGRCGGSLPRFYYNHELNRCEPFTFGGCLGNRNNFETEKDCQLRCQSQQFENVCLQKPSPGPCKGSFQRWFYDEGANQCSPFTYGGCKGNSNNFKSAQECQTRCIASVKNIVCHLPVETGPCSENVKSWHFDAAIGKCRQFIYGGCEGNQNRFTSRDLCEATCGKVKPLKHQICQVDKAEGTCGSSIQKWYFDRNANECKTFIYTGCGGNENQFSTEGECRAMCGGKPRQDACQLKADRGPCSNWNLQYYYNSTEATCLPFYYGGCQGNDNRFSTMKECRKACDKKGDVAHHGGADERPREHHERPRGHHERHRERHERQREHHARRPTTPRATAASPLLIPSTKVPALNALCNLDPTGIRCSGGIPAPSPRW